MLVEPTRGQLLRILQHVREELIGHEDACGRCGALLWSSRDADRCDLCPIVLGEIRICRECGCTDDDCAGCVAQTGEPCTWVAEDLCSACAILDDDGEPVAHPERCVRFARRLIHVGPILGYGELYLDPPEHKPVRGDGPEDEAAPAVVGIVDDKRSLTARMIGRQPRTYECPECLYRARIIRDLAPDSEPVACPKCEAGEMEVVADGSA